MNTPAHAVVNLLLLGRQSYPQHAVPILSGAVLPDMPLVLFYVYAKGVRGISEHVIWSQLYYDPSWQTVFDLFHSIPVMLVCALVAWRLGVPRLAWFFASMALHGVADFGLHNDDAHRHFFPLADWRFYSPLSYWDPRYHGQLMATLERVMVIAGCVVVVRRYTALGVRALIAGLVALYVLFWGYALWMWG